MKNTKMKYKTFFLMMLFLISLNNVSAVTYENGTLALSLEATQGPFSMIDGLNLKDFDEHAEGYDLYVTDISKVGIPQNFYYNNVEVGYLGAWEDIPPSVGGPFYIGTNGINGTGAIYFFKTATSGKVLMKVYFDDNYNCDVGVHNIYIYDDALSNYYTGIYFTSYSAAKLDEQTNAFGCAFTYAQSILPGKITADSGQVTFTNKGTFINDYSIQMDYSFGKATITRDIPQASLKSSAFIFKNETYYEVFNSGYSTSNAIYNYPNESGYYYIKPQANEIEYLIYSNVYIPPPDVTPTLTTDKSLYNTSELLTISYTNIDEMDIRGVPALFIVYPIIDDYHDYDAKFMQHLLSSKEDETFTINTSILQPQTEYYLVIVDNTDWSRIESAYITSDVFYVYPDEEYLTTSCTIEGNCYTYNGDYISIYYKVNNNSDIIIKDNNGNTIQTYYNIINEGEINYHIPDDLNKLNSYYNWTIYLNNTEYPTNYSTDVIVYWSLFATPTPTPVYTVDIPDENVSEQIDQLKEESKPVFDLIYGLTTLVIDNPDYDNDNIVDEHEINNWFNSLIPLGILLLLIILYMGLKKRD